jgi:transposase InsO family protein
LADTHVVARSKLIERVSRPRRVAHALSQGRRRRAIGACRNGEIVRVLFAIDACDREVMAWLARSAGISGEMMPDLMIACVERRFEISKAAHPVEWLSDNDSVYIALDTATALGLKLCFTPVRSGIQGHRGGIRQTFKRDYARLSILPDRDRNRSAAGLVRGPQ